MSWPSYLPELYPAGKTIGQLLPELNLHYNDLASYLGFAFILMPDNGREVSFVQRAKNLGIAPDCMALSGSTPQFPKQHSKGFDFGSYFESCVAEEMQEEFRIGSNRAARNPKRNITSLHYSRAFGSVNVISSAPVVWG